MKYTYQTFLKQDMDLAPLGVEKRSDAPSYFCTPEGAAIIGWAGMDGIHYCFIPGFGEMVFAVSPMNAAPDYVHPLARNFADFLRLLLACGDSAALEQAWQWNAEQFAAFLRENPPTKAQKAVLAQIAKQSGLSPMDNPWQYLHELQATFDYSRIPYTETFYEHTGTPDTPRQTPAWAVYFDGNFWGHRGGGQAGKEWAIHKTFEWAGHPWLIPSLYICGKGLVIDFCMRVEPSAIRNFMEKWDLHIESETHRHFSKEQQMLLDLDNPLHLQFHSTLQLNGKALHTTHGCGTAYIPCLPPAYILESEGQRAVDHYGLDPNFGWMIQRCCYPWATKRKPKIGTLSVTLTPDKISRPGPHFQVNRPGDTVTFTHPQSGETHVLTVQDYEAQTIDMSHMPHRGMSYPNHCVALHYTITPALPDGAMTLADCADSDLPRQVSCATRQSEGLPDAAATGIIGGADGPIAIFLRPNKPGKLCTACSSLHFAPVEHVEWRMIFHDKPFADTAVPLLAP